MKASIERQDELIKKLRADLSVAKELLAKEREWHKDTSRRLGELQDADVHLTAYKKALTAVIESK